MRDGGPDSGDLCQHGLELVRHHACRTPLEEIAAAAVAGFETELPSIEGDRSEPFEPWLSEAATTRSSDLLNDEGRKAKEACEFTTVLCRSFAEFYAAMSVPSLGLTGPSC